MLMRLCTVCAQRLSQAPQKGPPGAPPCTRWHGLRGTEEEARTKGSRARSEEVRTPGTERQRSQRRGAREVVHHGVQGNTGGIPRGTVCSRVTP